MNVIQVRPYGGGWKVFEAPGVEPFFTEGDAKRYALNYDDCKVRVRYQSGSQSHVGLWEHGRQRNSVS